ncbi:hypothetical protein PsorP6_005157 [Peronosclerospora sorghi]|uniref:Uncharacterized protein n=1 Tax=Peronosclerospora sorghi TaxID=230839 RepID=A0ACC0W3M5_9STRA|nr:hypothetical protein PsorP6_005157 [Peronosclerospora sorghi]
MDQLEHEYLRKARRKAPSSDYFDKVESDEEEKSVAFHATDTREDEVDPLDAFMVGIDAQVTQERNATPKQVLEKPPILQHEDDDVDTYNEHNVPTHILERSDSDEEVYATAKQLDAVAPGHTRTKHTKHTLPPVDHSTIAYKPFRKNFWLPDTSTPVLPARDVATLRSELNIVVDDETVRAPVRSFTHLPLDATLVSTLTQRGFGTPTPIQAQTLPLALAGRDVLGMATTGSGKTLAFVLPLVRHVTAQTRRVDGPQALVLAPTRELAHQVSVQTKVFLAAYHASCIVLSGGTAKWPQVQALHRGVDVIVATPGRLLDLMQTHKVRLERVTFVVLDEADRMFDLGFASHVRTLLSHVRPDRQTLLFAATFPSHLERLARQVLTTPVKVTIGAVGHANEHVHQVPVVLATRDAKCAWLTTHVSSLRPTDRVLVFVATKAACEALAHTLRAVGAVACLHGDHAQQERTLALQQFKTGACRVVVATDVAARGLDLHVTTVINFDVAKSMDIHVHRIGRTGRRGHEGTAYTLVTPHDTHFAVRLVKQLGETGHVIPPDLRAVAQGPRRRPGLTQDEDSRRGRKRSRSRSVSQRPTHG